MNNVDAAFSESFVRVWVPSPPRPNELLYLKIRAIKGQPLTEANVLSYLRLWYAFAHNWQGMSTLDISRTFGSDRSTTVRLLARMKRRGQLRQTPKGWEAVA